MSPNEDRIRLDQDCELPETQSPQIERCFGRRVNGPGDRNARPSWSAMSWIRTDRSCLEIRTEEQCPEIETMLVGAEMETSASSSGPHGSYKIYTPQSLGTAIRHYRKEAGLTQADLADQAGLNRTYLSNLESGKETEMLRRILRVLRQLGVGMTLEKEDSSAR